MPVQNSFSTISSRNKGWGSFADAIKGKKYEVPLQNSDPDEVPLILSNDVVYFKSKESEKSWIANSCTGYLKRDFNWEEHGGELEEVECTGT